MTFAAVLIILAIVGPGVKFGRLLNRYMDKAYIYVVRRYKYGK